MMMAMKCKNNSGSKHAYRIRPRYSLSVAITFMCPRRVTPVRIYTAHIAQVIAKMIFTEPFLRSNAAGFLIKDSSGNFWAVSVSVSKVRPYVQSKYIA